MQEQDPFHLYLSSSAAAEDNAGPTPGKPNFPVHLVFVCNSEAAVPYPQSVSLSLTLGPSVFSTYSQEKDTEKMAQTKLFVTH